MWSNKSLYEKYSARREAFQEALRNTSSGGFREALTAAVLNADLCIKVFTTLPPYVEAWSQNLQRLTKKITEDQERLVAERQERHAKIMRIKSTEIKREALIVDGNLADILRLSFERQASVLSNLLALPPLLVVQFESTLEELFSPGGLRHGIDVMLSLLDFLVGVSPLGPYISGIETIVKILRTGQSQLNAADKYLAELEDFIFASHHWAVTAHFTFCNLAATDDMHVITPEQANEQINALRLRSSP